MSSEKTEKGHLWRGFTFVALLSVFYLLTAPQNHSTAVDSYGFAYWITEFPLSAVPELRLFLWIATMKVVFDLAASVVPTNDPFVILGVVNAIQTAVAVLFLQRLLSVRLGVSREASWITAAAFAVSYGIWRYSAELEVYASAALISLALLYGAFSLETGDGLRRASRLAALAVFGGLATLAYQPLGIVAGIAIPVYLSARVSLSRILLYFMVSGTVVFLGLIFAHILDGASSSGGLGAIFDTDGKPLVVPNPFETGQAMVALVQNIISINWSFAFEPTRRVFEEYAGRQYQLFLYPGQFAGPGYLIFFLTIPLAAALFTVAAFVGLRHPSKRSIAAPEGAIIVWLLGHMAMVLLIDPGGMEAWLPAIIPFYILLGLRLVEPISQAGKGLIGLSIIAVLLLHNWFAGIQIISSAEHNYNDVRAEPVLTLSKPGDLILVYNAFAFDRYLSYTADVRNIDAFNYDPVGVAEMLEDTLAGGGKVFLFDDVVFAVVSRDGAEEPIASPLPEIILPLIEGARRIDLGPAGFAILVSELEG
jgi:hypothetical protein